MRVVRVDVGVERARVDEERRYRLTSAARISSMRSDTSVRRCGPLSRHRGVVGGWAAEVRLKCVATDLGDRDATTLRLVAKACVESVRDLQGRPFHVCQHTFAVRSSQRGRHHRAMQSGMLAA